MKNKRTKSLTALMAAIILIVAMIVPASAASSIEEQMAANSAAWHIANAAGDTETCERLHQANVALANQAAGSSGSASFNSSSGTWDITTSSGSRITSSGDSSSGGKSTGITYTTTTSSGRVSSSSDSSYSSSSINSYKNNGGTNSGLETAYNNDAARVSADGTYAKNNAVTTTQTEVAVVKELLGLTNAEAKQLEQDLSAHKEAYQSAQAAYQAAVASGDTAAAAEAKAQMDAAHEAAEETRAQYNYTGDTTDVNDGGYYDDWEDPSNPPNFYTGGGFTVTTTYQITSSCNAGGTIDPNGVYRVREGGSKTYTFTPNEGYMVKSVVVDGVDKGSLNSYTFTNVRSAHTITVTFDVKELAITASAGTGGSISPNGTVNVDYNTDKTFTITPNEGYEIQSIVVDGANKGKVTSYTFEDVKEAHTISATFVKKTFQITASAGSGGSISPNGRTTVSYGDSKIFTVAPANGYKIDRVIVDGVNKGAISSYTFSNVKAAHSISVSFVPSGEVDIDTPDVTDTDGGHVNGQATGDSIKSGYGIFAEVPVSYGGVTDVKVVMTYDFGSGMKTVVMEETGNGVFEYPVNSQSPLGKRCVYIPVETADGSYTLTFTITAKNVLGEVLTDTQTATVVVRGNMYEDDFTGDS